MYYIKEKENKNTLENKIIYLYLLTAKSSLVDKI